MTEGATVPEGEKSQMTDGVTVPEGVKVACKRASLRQAEATRSWKCTRAQTVIDSDSDHESQKKDQDYMDFEYKTGATGSSDSPRGFFYP